MTTAWLFALAALALGILLLWAGKAARQRRGLTDARTLDLDRRNLFSARLGLAGRPDRVIDEGGFPIPEEWKSSRRVHDSHRAQMGVYFILIEEETGIRPPHGYISLASGERERVDNTPELRAWVLEMAERVRAVRREPGRLIPVNQPPAKCRGCGMRESCGQRAV